MKEKAKNEYRCAVSRFVWLVVLMLALPALRGQAQTTVKGFVHDAAGEPLAGVTVIMNNNPKNATVTNLEGYYVLNGGSQKPPHSRSHTWA